MKRVRPLLHILFGGLALLLAACPAQAGYVDNGDGTVSDQSTGLVWEKAGSATDMNWEAALAWCESATTGGYTDWRLPDIRELVSIVDESRTNLAIDPVFSCTESTFWSGSTFVGDSQSAWSVSFGYGALSFFEKTTADAVRCVRGGLDSFVPAALNLLMDEQ